MYDNLANERFIVMRKTGFPAFFCYSRVWLHKRTSSQLIAMMLVYTDIIQASAGVIVPFSSSLR